MAPRVGFEPTDLILTALVFAPPLFKKFGQINF